MILFCVLFALVGTALVFLLCLCAAAVYELAMVQRDIERRQY